jgi:ubiquinone biosynthesis protein Coq4
MYQKVVATRSRILVFLTHHLALPVLKLIRKPSVFPYTAEELEAFPEGTLGKDLVHLLKANRFKLLTHYAKHDMKHLLLGYATTDEGEVCLQAFMLGNGHVSFPVVTTILFGLVTMPEYWSSFRKAYRRGKGCPPISNWNWFEIVKENTLSLQQKIFIAKNKNNE